jgi:hypothetical protein
MGLALRDECENDVVSRSPDSSAIGHLNLARQPHLQFICLRVRMRPVPVAASRVLASARYESKLSPPSPRRARGHGS